MCVVVYDVSNVVFAQALQLGFVFYCGLFDEYVCEIRVFRSMDIDRIMSYSLLKPRLR